MEDVSIKKLKYYLLATDNTQSLISLLTNTFRSCINLFLLCKSIVFPVVLPGTDEYEAQRESESKAILNEFHRKYGRDCPNFIPSSFKGAV